MSDKRYKIQLGSAKPEEVSQEQLDALKKRYGTRFTYDVTEVTATPKPKDLEASANKPAGRQSAASGASE